jgi:hypothetical protein
VSRFWLAYKQSGRLLGVVILDSSSLSSARMLASVERIDQGAAFGKGYRPDKGAADPETGGCGIGPARGDAKARDVPMTRRGKRPGSGYFWRGLFRCRGLFGSESCRNENGQPPPPRRPAGTSFVRDLIKHCNLFLQMPDIRAGQRYPRPDR